MDYIIIIVLILLVYLAFKVAKIIIKIPIIILTIIIGIVTLIPLIEEINGRFQNNSSHNLKTSDSNIVFLGDSLTSGENDQGKFEKNDLNIGYAQKIERENIARNLNNKISNYAVSGFETFEVEKQLNNDPLFTDSFELNKKEMEKKNIQNQEKYISGYQQSDRNLLQDVKNANYIIITIGNNDLLTRLTNPVSDKLEVNFSKVFGQINEVNQLRINLMKKINSINPNAKIIVPGSFVPYSDLSYINKTAYYNLINYYDTSFQIEKNKAGLNQIVTVIIRDNLQADTNSNFPVATNIHPGEIGYERIYNQIVRSM
jgi:lysophospholipase L1-like esterase